MTEKTIEVINEKIRKLKDQEDSIRNERQDLEAQARNLIYEGL